MSLCGAMEMAGVLADADVVVDSGLQRRRKRDLLSTQAGAVLWFTHSLTHTHGRKHTHGIIKHETAQTERLCIV